MLGSLLEWICGNLAELKLLAIHLMKLIERLSSALTIIFADMTFGDHAVSKFPGSSHAGKYSKDISHC